MVISKPSLLSMVLAGFFILAAIAVHFLHPELDWVRYSLSNYAIVAYGKILEIGLYCIGLSQIITALEIGKVYQKPTSAILLVLVGLGAIIVGIFPMDPGPNRTITGLMHTVGAFLEFALFPMAVSIIGCKLFQGRAKKYTLITGIATLIMFLLVFLGYFFYKESTVFGLIEKIDISLIAGWSFLIPYLMRERKNEARERRKHNEINY
ncbi:MAG: DUF998 domain-containing protein [Bacteroidota bacterium]